MIFDDDELTETLGYGSPMATYAVALAARHERKATRAREYRARPEVRSAQAARMRVIRESSPEYRALESARQKQYRARPDVLARLTAVNAEYRSRPAVRERRKAQETARRNTPAWREHERAYRRQYRAKKRTMKTTHPTDEYSW